MTTEGLDKIGGWRYQVHWYKMTEAYYLRRKRLPRVGDTQYIEECKPLSECGVMTQNDVCTCGLRPQA
jgi:hypothetical protein